MPTTKAYAILYDNDFLYFPISAEYNPYKPDKLSFGALMPAFFGGTRELFGKDDQGKVCLIGTRSDTETLRDEIPEESQGKYQLPGQYQLTDAQKIFENSDMKYYFYRIDITDFPAADKTAVFNECVCPLDMSGSRPAAEKEQCCIARIPKSWFTDVPEGSRMNRFISFCASLHYSTGQGLCCSNEAGWDDFHGCVATETKAAKVESETKKAFKAFLDWWLG